MIGPFAYACFRHRKQASEPRDVTSISRTILRFDSVDYCMTFRVDSIPVALSVSLNVSSTRRERCTRVEPKQTDRRRERQRACVCGRLRPPQYRASKCVE